MISNEQQAANQANAELSTGPRTEEGKARSSQNSLKHGVFAKTIVLPGESQLKALRELGRVVKAGGMIRLLNYVRPRGAVLASIARLSQPFAAWAFAASFDRRTEESVTEAGLELVDTRYVVFDLIRLIEARKKRL